VATKRADQDVLERFSDDELEAELTVAAYAPGRRRWERYQALIAERRRRVASRSAAPQSLRGVASSRRQRQGVRS